MNAAAARMTGRKAGTDAFENKAVAGEKTEVFISLMVGSAKIVIIAIQSSAAAAFSMWKTCVFAEDCYNFALIGSYLGVAPGLRYSFASCNTDDFGADSNWNEHYLDIPVMLNTGYDFSGNFGVYAFAGPTFSFGLASKLDVAASGMSTKLDMYDFLTSIQKEAIHTAAF